jgi:hypothetical protein
MASCVRSHMTLGPEAGNQQVALVSRKPADLSMYNRTDLVFIYPSDVTQLQPLLIHSDGSDGTRDA